MITSSSGTYWTKNLVKWVSSCHMKSFLGGPQKNFVEMVGERISFIGGARSYDTVRRGLRNALSWAIWGYFGHMGETARGR